MKHNKIFWEAVVFNIWGVSSLNHYSHDCKNWYLQVRSSPNGIEFLTLVWWTGNKVTQKLLSQSGICQKNKSRMIRYLYGGASYYLCLIMFYWFGWYKYCERGLMKVHVDYVHRQAINPVLPNTKSKTCTNVCCCQIPDLHSVRF